MQKETRSAYDAGGRRKYLTRSEGTKFLKGTEKLGKPERLLCQTVYFTGCRITEALALTGDDIDQPQAVIRILCLKKREKSETRRVPVPAALARELKALGSQSGDGKLWACSRTTGWRIIKGVMSAIGVQGIHATAKGLRHSFGVRAALGKIPLNVIQRWMGHADTATTAIYLAVRDEEERELIRRTW